MGRPGNSERRKGRERDRKEATDGFLLPLSWPGLGGGFPLQGVPARLARAASMGRCMAYSNCCTGVRMSCGRRSENDGGRRRRGRNPWKREASAQRCSPPPMARHYGALVEGAAAATPSAAPKHLIAPSGPRRVLLMEAMGGLPRQ